MYLCFVGGERHFLCCMLSPIGLTWYEVVLFLYCVYYYLSFFKGSINRNQGFIPWLKNQKIIVYSPVMILMLLLLGIGLLCDVLRLGVGIIMYYVNVVFIMYLLY